MKAVDGGADPSGSLKMSRGDTVRIDPEWTEGSFMDVKADAVNSNDMSLWKAGPRPAPMFESNELLLFRSAMFATCCCGMLLVELENRGTGGR